MPPEAAAALQQSAQQACDALKSGEDAAKFDKAVAACASTGCGTGGSDYTTCIMQKLTE